MDQFTTLIYEALENDKSRFLDFLKSYISENGSDCLNRRDSTGNCLIHYICMALSDQDSAIFDEILKFLLQSPPKDTNVNYSVQINLQNESQAVKNFMRGLPIAQQYKSETLGQMGIETSSESHKHIFKV